MMPITYSLAKRPNTTSDVATILIGHLLARFYDKEEHGQPATCMRGRSGKVLARAILPPYDFIGVVVIEGVSRTIYMPWHLPRRWCQHRKLST